jgi:hypothetical protein
LTWKEDIEKLKGDFLHKAQLADLVEDKQARKEKERRASGLSDIPVGQMIDQAMYIRDELLPAVEKKKGGKEGADYKFFSEVFRSLLYAVVMADRYEFQARELGYAKLTGQIVKEQLEYFQRELVKYTTLEDLFRSDALDHYAQGVKNRAEDLLKGKK